MSDVPARSYTFAHSRCSAKALLAGCIRRSIWQRPRSSESRRGSPWKLPHQQRRPGCRLAREPVRGSEYRSSMSHHWLEAVEKVPGQRMDGCRSSSEMGHGARRRPDGSRLPWWPRLRYTSNRPTVVSPTRLRMTPNDLRARELQQRPDVVVICGPKSGDISSARFADVGQSLPAPCKRFVAEPRSHQISHQARRSTITVGKRVDCDKPVMQTLRQSRRAGKSRVQSNTERCRMPF